MKAVRGEIVDYWLGEGEHAKVYVSIVLAPLDDNGKAFIRVINHGRGDTVVDFNTDADFSDKPKSLHWSYPQSLADSAVNTSPDPGSEKPAEDELPEHPGGATEE